MFVLIVGGGKVGLNTARQLMRLGHEIVLVEQRSTRFSIIAEELGDEALVFGDGTEVWVLEKAGIPVKLTVPHKAFHRNIGALKGVKVSPDGRVVSEAEWNAKVNSWLPSGDDRAFVASLMGRVVEPGQFANWISPPVMGINRQPVDFEYVRFN